MSNLQIWSERIKEKRKQTPFREFLKDIASWSTFVLHKNNGLISKFPESNRVNTIISHQDFEITRDSLCDKGIEYNFNCDFFENYRKLFLNTPLFNFISYGGSVNSDYADMCLYSKNCYLSSTIINACENVLYSFSVKDNCSDIINSVSVYQNSQIVYFSVGIIESFKIFYSSFINNSSDIWFSSNLVGCQECIFCDNLENLQYYIENKKYSQEEYFQKKSAILRTKQDFFHYHKKVNKVGNNNNSTNVTGIGFVNSLNIENGYYGYNVNKGRNLVLVGGINGDKICMMFLQEDLPLRIISIE